MKKSISVNMSGLLFNIEEDAYERLKRYLDEIKVYFASYDASGEIVADIENRIAEIFSTKIGPYKQVLTMADVEALITQMGNIQDFAAIDDLYEEPAISTEEGPKAKNKQAYESYGEPKTGRRLYRDESRKVIGGVAAGIASYFRIEPSWVRLLLVMFVAFDIFLTFALSSTALVIGYIVLWVVLPARNDLPEEKKVKKLYRDPENKVIGGVAGGLGAFFGVDPVPIRILFVLGMFTGFGLIAYIILWICMPEAKTLTERMRMQGEPVTLANIEHQVKKKLDVKEGEEESPMARILLFPFRMLSVIFSVGSAGVRSLFHFLGEAIRVISGFSLATGGFFLLLAMLITLGVYFGLYPVRYLQIFGAEAPLGLLRNTIPDYLFIAATLVTAIPVLYILFMGIALLAKRWVLPKTASWSLAGAWVVAFIICSAMIPALIIDYNTNDYVDAEANYFQADSNKTLVLRMENGRWKSIPNVDLKIKGTPDGKLRLEKRILAHGADHDEAREHANWVSYSVNQQDSVLLFSNHLSLPDDKPYYLQQVKATLYIPYGQPFKIDYNMKKALRGSAFFTLGHRSRNIRNKTFIFNQSGEMECISCPKEEQEEVHTSQLEVEADQQNPLASLVSEKWIPEGWLKSRNDKKPVHIYVAVPSLAGIYLSGASRNNVKLP